MKGGKGRYEVPENFTHPPDNSHPVTQALESHFRFLIILSGGYED